MRNTASSSYSFLLVVGDFLTILASFTCAYILRVTLDDRPLVEEIPALTFFRIFVILSPLWIITFALLGLYKQEIYSRRFPEIGRLLVGSFVGILLVIGYEFVSEQPIFPARLVPVYALLFSFLLLVLTRSILWQVRQLMFRYGWWINRVMIIGNNPTTKELASILSDTKTSGYDIVAVVGPATIVPKSFRGKHFSQLDDGLQSLKNLRVHTIVQTRLYEDESKNSRIAGVARTNHVAYKFIPGEEAFSGGRPNIELFHFFPVISVHQTPLLGWGRIVKRLFDFFASLIALVIFSPLFLGITLIIKIFDPGPLFFTQKRLTRFGTEVEIYKFRSLLKKYNARDPETVFNELGQPELFEEFQKNRSKVENDPRIGRIGRLLRSTSLDELPQLFNVLKGDISLVGPRAIPAKELDGYATEKPVLLSVKSGITGLAQVTGRSDISMDERIRLDLFYVQNWSFWLDVRIILKTIWVVFAKLGAR